MSKYLVAPYLFQVHARAKQGAVAKPLSDIDAKKSHLRDVVGSVLTALKSRSVNLNDNLDPSKEYEVQELKYNNGDAYLLTVAPGRRGVESQIKSPNGGTVKRNAADSEFIPLRHLLLFPNNAHSALIFAERFGRYGTITFLRSCIYHTLNDRFPALTIDIDPLTTLEALKQAKFRKITYTSPPPKDATGRLLDFGPSIDIEVDVKEPRSLKNLIKKDGKVSRQKVFGVLKDEAGPSGLKPPRANAGWDVSMTVELSNGQTRSFDIEDDGPALVYPLSGATINGTIVSATFRPTDSDFIDVCNQILADIEGQYEVTDSTRAGSPGTFNDWLAQDPHATELRYHDQH